MTAKTPARLLGVMGGSGVYQVEGLTNARWERVSTPFGDPSDELLFGEVSGQPLVFLPRHGRRHHVSPTEINYRANIAALKSVGVTDLLSMSAVGSLKEGVAPGTFVVVDQFIDRTFAREKSFFEGGVVAHVSMAHPVCRRLGDLLMEASRGVSVSTVRGGTYLCMEGPQFSSLAESRLYRSWGCDVIGMTNMPEAKLAREAELCYASVAMVTDFDCWHESHGHVTVADIISQLHKNAGHARELVTRVTPLLSATAEACPQGCDHALQDAVLTPLEAWPAAALEKLSAVAGRLIAGHRVTTDEGDDLRAHIRTIPDFPKKGIAFRDITTLLQDKAAFRRTVNRLAERYRRRGIDKIVAIEARGFMLGSALAFALGAGFVPLRKPGKLPHQRMSQRYALEYGTDELEIHLDALRPGERVLLVDDLIATGGTADAGVQLVKRLGAVLEEACFLVELPALGGRARVEQHGCPVFSLMSFEGH